ncbi:MAG: hypothetical protein HOP29_18990 [Phycisphaerales bacterium]|nr:hypothetical protein [Phycisphaerales bacterium]
MRSNKSKAWSRSPQQPTPSQRQLIGAVPTTSGEQNGHTLERVEYEYAYDGDAAGNVRRVVRKVADPPQPVPDEWFVYATEFFYNRAGEAEVISQRRWNETPAGTANVSTQSIREFRGNGRTRYMMRDRIADERASGGALDCQW